MEKLFKGTKGNWSVYNNSVTRKGKLGIIMSWDENGQNPVEVASVYTSKAQANAKLIACAPEMLEMLQDILKLQQENYGKGSKTHMLLMNKVPYIELLIKKATQL